MGTIKLIKITEVIRQSAVELKEYAQQESYSNADNAMLILRSVQELINANVRLLNYLEKELEREVAV